MSTSDINTFIEDVLDAQLDDFNVVEGTADSDQETQDQEEEQMDDTVLAETVPADNTEESEDNSEECKSDWHYYSLLDEELEQMINDLTQEVYTMEASLTELDNNDQEIL